MTKLGMGVLMCVVVGCGGVSDEPPSCQQAMQHYYGAGCAFSDLNSGQEIPVNTMTARCLEMAGIASDVGPRCEDPLDAWLVCLNAVPTPSTTNAQCDCSQEQMTLLTCE